MRAEDQPRQSLIRGFDRRTACQRRPDIGQVAARRGDGPIGGAPQTAAVEGERNRLAERDLLVRDDSGLTWMQSKLRQATGGPAIGDQRQRAIAGLRFTDANEHVAGAEIKAALEH